MDQIADVSPAGKYAERRQLNLQTGSYYGNYRQLKDSEVLDQSYAASSAHPPKPMGGVYLCLRPGLDATTGELSIEQDFMSDIILPWKPAKLIKAKKRKSLVDACDRVLGSKNVTSHQESEAA